MQDYSIEVGAIIEDIVIYPESVLVRLNVRGSSKEYQNFNKAVIDEVRIKNFTRGERVRLLYANKDRWTLKRYSNAYGMDRYLKKDE